MVVSVFLGYLARDHNVTIEGITVFVEKLFLVDTTRISRYQKSETKLIDLNQGCRAGDFIPSHARNIPVKHPPLCKATVAVLASGRFNIHQVYC